MASKTNPEVSALLAEVNARISEYASGIDVGAQDWEFVCECPDLECHTRVRLTVAEYEALRASGGHVLADGHAVSRAEHAHRRAERLVDDATGLIAQARHQVSRARRLRRDA